MDVNKFFKDLTNNENLKDVPIEYIFKVSIQVLQLLQDNKYTFKIGD